MSSPLKIIGKYSDFSSFAYPPLSDFFTFTSWITQNIIFPFRSYCATLHNNHISPADNSAAPLPLNRCTLFSNAACCQWLFQYLPAEIGKCAVYEISAVLAQFFFSVCNPLLIEILQYVFVPLLPRINQNNHLFCQFLYALNIKFVWLHAMRPFLSVPYPNWRKTAACTNKNQSCKMAAFLSPPVPTAPPGCQKTCPVWQIAESTAK